MEKLMATSLNAIYYRVFLASFYLLNLVILALMLLPLTNKEVNLWRLDNLLNLQLQWAFFALLLMFINIFYIKKLRFFSTFLYITVIAINFQPLYLFTFYPLDKHLNQQRYTIAQLNLNYNNPNLNQLLPILGHQDFDLLVIQEASDSDHENIKQLMHYYPFSFGLSASEATPSGLALFSRWPIIEKQIHNLGDEKGQLLEVLIKQPNSDRPVQVYALHPTSPRSKKLWQQRNQTLMIAATKAATSPFVHKLVIGDFNSSPWSSSFKNMLKISQLKNSANGFGYLASWSYSVTPLLSLLSSVYIDHTLISDSFSVLNKHSKPIQGSDHRMVITELVIKQ